MTDDPDVAQMKRMLAASGRRGLGRAAARIGWVLVAVGAPWFGYSGLPWMVKTGREKAELCRQAHVQQGTRIGEDCRAGVWLGPPKLFAWTRDDASQASRSVAASAARADLDWAARVVVRPEAVDEAFRRYRAERVAGRPDGGGELGLLLKSQGAFDQLAKLDPSGERDVYSARLRVGDLDGAAIAAATAAPSIPTSERLQRAAFLCLTGHASEAATLIEAASESEPEKARSLSAFCSARSSPPQPRAAGVAAELGLELDDFARVALSDPRFMSGRRQALGAWLGPLAADVIEGREQSKARFVKSLDDQDYAEQDGGFFPDEEMLSGLRSTHPLPGAWLARGADRLLAWADEGGDLQKELTALSAGTRSLSRAKSWPLLFRRMAWITRLDAATNELVMGRRKEAIELARAASAIAPAGLSVLSAKLLVASGDAKGALELCAAADKTGGLSGRVLGVKLEAEIDALIELERWDEALTAAKTYEAKGGRAWARAALEVRLDKRDLLGELHSPPLSDKPEEDLASWLALAQANEAERAPLRLKLTSVLLLKSDDWATPFALYVVSKAAPPEGDADLWIDIVTGGWWAYSMPGRSLFRARRTVAKLAGDPARVTRWEERHRALQALVIDPRTALLAEKAGI
ncbi:MAG: hypothetical protein IPM79_15890 [Polyangiaceae bacterium]|nr:hypothetical protein [Polyangiaceae bacterium]